MIAKTNECFAAAVLLYFHVIAPRRSASRRTRSERKHTSLNVFALQKDTAIRRVEVVRDSVDLKSMAPPKAKGNTNMVASSPSDTSMADTNSHVNGGNDEDSVMVPLIPPPQADS